MNVQKVGSAQSEYRRLPGVDRLLQEPVVVQLVADYGQGLVVEAARLLLEQARTQIHQGQPAPPSTQWPELLAHHLAVQLAPTLRPVINATGVILHTNLGRAPLSQAARDAVAQLTHGYSNLEYDLAEGGRGSRYDHSREMLCTLSGAEDALVVNNNAAAVLLVLAALCQGREVVVSRGELVEIGGGFRIPDVLRQSGARLVEVGTTNRTHPQDFADAIRPETAAVMRIHASNFKQIGFTAMPSLAELVQIAGKAQDGGSASPLVFDDLGSGSFLDTSAYGLAPEPMVQQSVADGADIVTFSGDKLLGGPQAGLIVGRADLIQILRRHPLLRALRVDKMTLAGLDATLRSYRQGRAEQDIPVWQMLSAPAARIEARVQRWLALSGFLSNRAALWPGESAVGGGSLPGESLPTFLLAVAIEQPDQAATALRRQKTPLLCRIQSDHLLFDPRTVLLEQDELFLQTIQAVLS